MNKIDVIKNRKLSKYDENKIHHLANKSVGEVEEVIKPATEVSQTPQEIKQDKTAIEEVVNQNNYPDKIITITKIYFMEFRKNNTPEVAAMLTQAAMSLDSAALIAQAIKEGK